MPEPTTLVLFAGAALALLVVPGSSVLDIVTRGIHQGRSAALDHPSCALAGNQD